MTLTVVKIQVSHRSTGLHFAWFQGSSAKYLRTALFWVVTQTVMLISYRRFGITYLSLLQWSRIQLKMEEMGRSETSVKITTTSCVTTQKRAVLIILVPVRSYSAMMLTGEQTCPSIISSTINFTWTKPETNPGPRVEKPDSNLLTRGTDAVFITCPNPRCVALSCRMDWCRYTMYFNDNPKALSAHTLHWAV